MLFYVAATLVDLAIGFFIVFFGLIVREAALRDVLPVAVWACLSLGGLFAALGRWWDTRGAARPHVAAPQLSVAFDPDWQHGFQIHQVVSDPARQFTFAQWWRFGVENTGNLTAHDLRAQLVRKDPVAEVVRLPEPPMIFAYPDVAALPLPLRSWDDVGDDFRRSRDGVSVDPGAITHFGIALVAPFTGERKPDRPPWQDGYDSSIRIDNAAPFADKQQCSNQYQWLLEVLVTARDATPIRAYFVVWVEQQKGSWSFPCARVEADWAQETKRLLDEMRREQFARAIADRRPAMFHPPALHEPMPVTEPPKWYAAVNDATGEAVSFASDEPGNIAPPEVLKAKGLVLVPIDHQPGAGETWDPASRDVVRTPQWKYLGKRRYFGLDWQGGTRDGEVEVTGPYCPKDERRLEIISITGKISLATDDIILRGGTSDFFCHEHNGRYRAEIGGAFFGGPPTLGDLRKQVADLFRRDAQ